MVIFYSEYSKWNKKSDPNFGYSQYKPSTTIVTEKEYLQGKIADCVEVNWQQDIREYLAYFFDEVIRLKEIHGKIRFVFGFDS